MVRNGKRTFSIAICDDDKRYVKHLRDMIKAEEKQDGDFGMSFFFTGYDLLEKDVRRFNLLVMDMVLPDADGRKIAQEFRKRNKEGMIVFCTGKKSPIPDDFKIEPYRFIRKEYELQLKKDLRETLDELYRREAKEQICLTAGKVNVVINIEEILYIEIIKNGSQIHYYNEYNELCVLQVKERIKEIYPYVFPFGFAYAHNSYLVNCHKIKKWNTKDVILVDNTCLTISRSKEKSFHNACIRYIE